MWSVPETEELKQHVHFYNLKATHNNEDLETTQAANAENYYAFMDLEPATTYKFKVQACSEYTKRCGNWSTEINGTTYDGGKYFLIDLIRFFELRILVEFQIKAIFKSNFHFYSRERRRDTLP